MSGGSYNYLCHKHEVDELIRGGLVDYQRAKVQERRIPTREEFD